MSRLPLTSRTDFPEELTYVWDAVARDRRDGNPPNNPAVLRAYLRLGNGLWSSCGLDVPTRELVILLTAILQKSEYEWHQHVRLGRAAGLSDERIRALHTWQESSLFSDAEKALLAYVDAVNGSGLPSEELHEGLAKHYSPDTVIGINLLAGFYVMTAKFLGGMAVQPEETFIGWQLEAK